jgi:hypothetical protein
MFLREQRSEFFFLSSVQSQKVIPPLNRILLTPFRAAEGSKQSFLFSRSLRRKIAKGRAFRIFRCDGQSLLPR